MVFLSSKQRLLVCLVSGLVVPLDVFAPNYERADGDLHIKRVRTYDVFEKLHFHPELAKAVAVGFVNSLNAGRNLNRLHY